MTETLAQSDILHGPLSPQRIAADDAQADPLLGCLEVVARYYDCGIPRQALISGLPLPEGRLTPRLFPRAAMRAGLSAKVVRRPLGKLNKMLLPAILIMADDTAMLLTGVGGSGDAEVVIPETGSGTSAVKFADLEERYSGYVILLKPEFRYTERAEADNKGSRENWLWDSVWPLWPIYCQVVIAAALVNILALASPLFIMNVYDRVLPNKAISTLWVLVIGIGLAIAFDFLLKTLRVALIGNAGRRADVLLASRLFAHVLSLDLSSRPHRTGEFANHLKDFEIVREFFTSNTVVTITDLLFVGLFIFIIYQISGVTAYVPAVAVVLVVIIGLLIQPPMHRVVDQAQAEAGYRHSLLLDAISGLETIKCARAESQMQRQWEQFVGQNSETAQKLRNISSVGLNLSAFVQQSVTVGVVVVGAYLFEEGEVSSGAIIASVILAGRAVAPLGQLASTFARSQQAFSSLRMLNQLMSLPEDGEGETRHINRTIESGSIHFDNVTFEYPDATTQALKDFSLRIEPGERVGIIGKIGSGKTTIGRLLSRLYMAGEGNLLLDDVDVRQYHPSEVRRRVAFVAQDAALFHGSVRDNIVFGAPYVSDDVVVRAAELSGTADFVKLHPHGYNMPVGEGGRLLSSGQRHSLALARAFLFDPVIVFLDEPTGAMDMQSERMLLQRLKTAFRPDQTVIITTHRSSMLNLVNRVIVIDQGQVVLDGPKDEVMKQLTAGRQAASAQVGKGRKPAPKKPAKPK
ncbi:MAG: type I secretion system permease/ATPase [Hyphomicrobiales bacterium]|nr:type I secretion system permease/ATPase [Hyphomicrobiales bacterium]